VPYNSMKRLSKISDINVLGVKNLTEAMEALFE
jgi:hypothetical protein